MKTAAAPKQVPNTTAKTTGHKNPGFAGKYTDVVIAGGIALVTFLFLQVCLGLKLTNWDDLGYVISNPLIKDRSDDAIKNIFSTAHPVMGNYHPITILFYWWEYGKVGLEPYLYHLDSVLCHLAVTVAVYGFVKVLTRRTVAAAVAALLFGLHPMHIESVAWVAGRKDLIYGFFFVVAMTTYLYYVRNESKKPLWYGATLVLFALSLLSKSVGVTFPVVLLLIDYYEKRPLNFKLILEKIPFFALSLLFGILSINAQKDIGALTTESVEFSGIERFALGFYALLTYIWKAVVPAGLTNFYSYPLKEHGSLPVMYYLCSVAIAALGFVIWKYGRKNRMVILAAGFFVVNLLLLLQFIPVGGTIFSDRYSYIPYLGLFLMAGWFVSNYFEKQETTGTGKMLLGGVVVYALVLGVVSNARAKDWYDSVTLWKDNIEKRPESPVGYFYLGQEYYSRFESATNPQEQKSNGDSAFYYFNQSVAHKPDYINPIVCIGEYQRATNQVDAAKQTYLRALQIAPKNESVYLGLGVVYAIKQQYDSSEYAFKKALSLKAYFPEGHANIANFYYITGKADSALAHYAIAISQNPDAYIPYMNRAKIYMNQGKWKEAITDYNKAIQIKPENGEPYYNRGYSYGQLGNQAEAKQDIDHAKALGFAPKQ